MKIFRKIFENGSVKFKFLNFSLMRIRIENNKLKLYLLGIQVLTFNNFLEKNGYSAINFSNNQDSIGEFDNFLTEIKTIELLNSRKEVKY